MNGKKQRRRRKVVDGKLQYMAIAIALTVVVAGFVVFAGIAWLYYAIAGLRGSVSGSELLLVILPPLLVNDLVIMVLAVIVGIFMTHRIAGPIYRMEEDIDKALAGDSTVRVRLRGRDAFQSLAERVNHLIERIDETRTR